MSDCDWTGCDNVLHDHLLPPAPTTAAEVLRLAVRKAGWDVAEFDRVLARHDREVAARALRDAAGAIVTSLHANPLLEGLVSINGGAQAMRDYAVEHLTELADEIERGEGA